MRIRQTGAYIMIVGGLLLFSGGSVHAEQESGGTPGGAVGSGSGTGSGSTGGSSGSMKQDQKHGIDGRTDVPKTKGDPTLGGSGKMPDPSTGTPGAKGMPGKGSSGGSGSGSSGMGSGSMGSGSGSMGSGGMGSSGSGGGQ